MLRLFKAFSLIRESGSPCCRSLLVTASRPWLLTIGGGCGWAACEHERLPARRRPQRQQAAALTSDPAQELASASAVHRSSAREPRTILSGVWVCCCESSEQSGDAQAAYLGVLAPRLPPHIAEVSPKPHELFLKTIFVRLFSPGLFSSGLAC